MGKRKKSSRKPVGKKRNDPLPNIFSCLFCNHEQSVTVKLDKRAFVGQLECRICGQTFQCIINHLSAPVDVYAEWVDAADAVAAGDNEEGTSAKTTRSQDIDALLKDGRQEGSTTIGDELEDLY